MCIRDSSYPVNNKGAAAYCVLDKANVPHKLFDFSLFSRVKDFQIQSSLWIEHTKEHYDKKSWAAFWKRFNLLQFANFQDCHLKKLTDAFQLQFLAPLDAATANTPTENTVISDATIAEVLTYYEEAFHSIVTQLLKHDISFSQEGSFELMDEQENGVLAEAILGFRDKKIVIAPYDEEYEQIFKDLGYRIISVADFDIDLLK